MAIKKKIAQANIFKNNYWLASPDSILERSFEDFKT
jgi:hypothetical protein